MSDFDKFFAEKFDGESQFPRREKNWNQLSKRLDAFDAGIDRQQFVSRTRLRYWQAAAAVTLLLTAALAWWAVSVRQHNAALQREVAGLTEKIREHAEKAPAPSLQTASGSPEAPETAQPNTPQKITRETAGIAEKEAGRQEIDAPGPPKRNTAYAAGDRPAPHRQSAAGTAQASGSATADNAPTLPGSAAAATAGTERGPADGLPAAPGQSRPDSARNLSPAPAMEIPTLTLLPPGPDTVNIRFDAPLLIKPVRQPSRFRLGVEAVAGTAQPHQTGVSAIYGTGVTGEFNLLRNFWIGASADWLQFEVATDEYIPKVHPHHDHHNDPPDPPHGGGGGGPNPDPSKLVKVESTQRQQHYALGLRYALPFRFWVRPAVRVAHTWINTSPELVSFKFEKPWSPNPGGNNDPEYVVRKYESQHLSNIWRFGVGLEKETPRWVFGLWADYSDNFGPGEATIDMLLFRAGVQYRFN